MDGGEVRCVLVSDDPGRADDVGFDGCAIDFGGCDLSIQTMKSEL